MTTSMINAFAASSISEVIVFVFLVTLFGSISLCVFWIVLKAVSRKDDVDAVFKAYEDRILNSEGFVSPRLNEEEEKMLAKAFDLQMFSEWE